MVKIYSSDSEFQGLPVYADDLISLSSIISDYLNETRDYGNGVILKNQDAHILSVIERYPGTTVSELTRRLNRTKGTISARISSLAKAGLVRREKRRGNDKVVHIYTTPEGEAISTRYRSLLVLGLSNIEKRLLDKHSTEDIATFCKLLHDFDTELDIYISNL